MKHYIEKPEDFMKLLTKRISYIELRKLVSMVVILWFLSEKNYWFKSVFSSCKKNFFNSL